MRFVGLLLLVSLFAACNSLRYNPPQTTQEQEELRQLSITQQLEKSFGQIGKKFRLLTLGQTTTVKPDSFRKLDSLFNRKYLADGAYIPELEEAIQRQQAIIANDTLHVVYQNPIWFELTDSSTHEFIQGTVTTNKVNYIENVDIHESFTASGENLRWAEIYIKETSFLTTGVGLTSSEDRFYEFYKTRAAQLSGNEKQVFMDHTFRLMALGSRLGTLSTERLLQELSRVEVNKLVPGISDEAYTLKAEEVTEQVAGKSTFLFYEVTAQLTDGRLFTFRYNEYLMPVSGQ